MNRNMVWALIVGMGVGAGVGCGAEDDRVIPPESASVSTPANSSGGNSDSEIATSVVSGALNVSGGEQVGFQVMPRQKRSLFERVVDELNPIGKAFAAMWQCSGGTLSPTFAGPGSYTFTPVSCSATFNNGHTGSSSWSSTFALNFGASCDINHVRLENQAAGCAITRTTSSTGNARTITGPNGGTYSVNHNTNGEATGYDATVTPAPSNGGVVASCSSSGCAAARTLVINGSHIVATATPSGGQAKTVWDHTVSTGAGGLTVTGVGINRLVSGTVNVQHNLARYTSSVTFSNVGYGEAGCCFPTTGSVNTSFHSGANQGKTETLAFSASCGEATLTDANGTQYPITLQHCL